MSLAPFGHEVDLRLRHVHGVDVEILLRPAERRHEVRLLGLEHAAIVDARERREPAAVAAHHLVDHEGTGRGAVLLDDVPEILGALLRRRVGAEGLLDRIHIVIDGLGQTDHRQLVAVLREIGGEISGGGVRVVATDGVQHVHAVLHQLVGSDLERILARLDQTALHAVLDVRELHAAVADRAAAVLRVFIRQ